MYVNCGLCKTKEIIDEIITTKCIIGEEIFSVQNFIFLL